MGGGGGGGGGRGIQKIICSLCFNVKRTLGFLIFE